MAIGRMMTADDAKAKVEKIRAISRDFEAAAIEEKSLWEHALIAAAEGRPDAQEIADIALSSREIEFPRRYS